VKFNKEAIEVYQLVPMLKNIAEEYGGKETREMLHKIVTKYYILILEQILKENSVSQQSKENEVLMNNLWFFETNIWDWVYRSLEIKKNVPLDREDTYGTDSQSPSKNPFKKEYIPKVGMASYAPNGKRIEEDKEESDNDSLNNVNHLDTTALLEAEKVEQKSKEHVTTNGKRKMTETNLLKLIMNNRMEEKKKLEEDEAFEDILNKVKGQIMPRGITGDLEDSNVLSFIQKSVLPEKKDTSLIKPKPKPIKKKKVDSTLGDNTSFLIREMDKRLKKTVNDKVAQMIKNDKKLCSLTLPKEEVYQKLSHKLIEMQDKHKLYKGDATNVIFAKGKTMKEVTNDSKILILYLSNLILFSKKSDAVKTIDEYGKYFYDRNLWEANLRKLKALALIRSKKDKNFESAFEAIKEFLHAKVIFMKHDCSHGVGIWWAGIGFILYEIFIHFVKNKVSLLKYAKKTFVESLLHYEKINHKYAMSFCYDMLQDIKRNIGEDFSIEYRNYLLLQNKIREDIENERHTFIERIQGAEMSLFIENVMSVASASLLEKHEEGNLEEMVHHLLERKKLVESLEQENEKESKNFMSNFISIISEPAANEGKTQKIIK
jgi:hypothetical protein